MGSNQEAHIRISDDGTVTMLGGDDLDLTPLGRVSCERVSHIVWSDLHQHWYVYDLSMTRLPHESGFKTREQALTWERKWAKEWHLDRE